MVHGYHKLYLVCEILFLQETWKILSRYALNSEYHTATRHSALPIFKNCHSLLKGVYLGFSLGSSLLPVFLTIHAVRLERFQLFLGTCQDIAGVFKGLLFVDNVILGCGEFPLFLFQCLRALV